MPIFNAVAAALAWLGRQGTRALAASVFAGLALPPLASAFKPFFVEALVALLALAFLRVNPSALRGYFKRPGLVIAASAWTMLAIPLLVGLPLLAFDAPRISEALFVAVMLHAFAPPVIGSPALASLLGLDAALPLATLIVATAVTPLTVPLLAALFIGPALDISPVTLGLKLIAMLGGAALTASLIRRLAGQAWVDRQSDRIDGLSVLVLFVFAIGVMDGVAAYIIAQPLLVAGLALFAFAFSLALIGLTYLVMRRAGPSAALALGLAVGSRNMGLMVAAAGAVPELTWLYFAIVQFPIYLLPQMLKPLARRINSKG